jgi:hypothetical protein
MPRRTSRGAVLALALVAAAPAAGEDRKVYSPYVEPGVFELEMRGERTIDGDGAKNDQQTHIYEVAYGVNPWWYTALFGRLEKDPGADFRYAATAWENIFQLTEPGEHFVDVGLYVEYARSHLGQSPDELETKLLLEKNVAPLTLTANLIFNREIGANAGKGVGFEYAVRANYPWRRELQFAVEAYGEPGRLTGFDSVRAQDHVLGPVLNGKLNIAGLPGTLRYEAGYLFGLTDASARGAVKWLLEWEFPF